MKKFSTYLILMAAILMNIYLIFYWQPTGGKYIKNDISKKVISYSKSIYKVNKKDAINKLQDNDKKEIDTIIYKLSAFDIGKIDNYIEDAYEDRGVINTFKILKKRLSEEDYNRIKEICSIFLDINELEKQL